MPIIGINPKKHIIIKIPKYHPTNQNAIGLLTLIQPIHNINKKWVQYWHNNSIIEQIDEYLQKYGADITNKLQTQLRQPPLYFAINLPDDQSSLSVMRRLVQFGANVLFKDQNQQTVIFYACRDGKVGCVEFLQGLGVSMYEEDAYGQTPLYYIASQNQLQLLSKYTKPEQFNHVDKLAQQTPLYYAAKKGHLQMCKQLVANGCDINHHDSNNKTAVQYARRAREHDVAQYLSNQIKRQKDAKMQIVKEKEQSKVMQEEIQSHSRDVKKMVKKQVESESVCNVQRSFYKIVVVNDQGQTKQLTEEDIRVLIRQRPNLEQVLANPGSIPRQTLESQKPAEQREKWQKIATKILTLCWKNKSSVWFQQPVDPVKFGITDYNDIVSHPMDLGTIKKKLAYNFYASPQQFAADIKLVWDNCYKYNGSQHEISICAKEVQGMFNQLYQKQLKMFESS